MYYSDLEKNNPICLGGFGDINFGKQYREGNRVYDSRKVACALKASPVGNMGGYTNLYLVIENEQIDFSRSNSIQEMAE